MKVFLQLFWFFKLYWKSYLGAVLLLMLIALLGLFPPLLVGELIDRYLQHDLSASQQGWVFALLILLGLAVYGLRYCWRVLLFGASYRLSFLLRNRLYRHFMAMDRSFYQRHRTGDLLAHATNDVQAVEMVAAQGVLTLVDSLAMGSMVLVMMAWRYSWELTLLSVLPLPIMAWVVSKLGRAIYSGFHQAQEAFSDLNNQVQESLSGIRVLKSFAVESLEHRRFSDLAEQALEKNMRVARLNARFDPVIYLCIGISFFLALAGGSYLIVQQRMTLGELTSFSLYLGQLIWPMFALAWLFNLIERGHASLERIERLLDTQTGIEDPLSPQKLHSPFPVNVRNLGYQHQGSQFRLDGINVCIRQGQMLGIVGCTGAGKSALLQLLLRLDDPTQGAIELAGRNMNQYSVQDVREQFACVPQQPFLFSMSIAQNIAMGNPQASQNEIEHVARLACVDADIRALPEGYQTQVGERGVSLSGGQKQRIAIARALLLDSPILVLDDALSAVDARTEHEILGHILREATRRTLIIASHRMSAVERADEILVLDHGRITERGSHQQLIAVDSWYARMTRFQRLEQEL